MYSTYVSKIFRGEESIDNSKLFLCMCLWTYVLILQRDNGNKGVNVHLRLCLVLFKCSLLISEANLFYNALIICKNIQKHSK